MQLSTAYMQRGYKYKRLDDMTTEQGSSKPGTSKSGASTTQELQDMSPTAESTDALASPKGDDVDGISLSAIDDTTALPTGTVDPVYEAKARVLNRAVCSQMFT
jgi:hypothetical protein